MKARFSLHFLLLIALVFNQVAASIHVVEHVTPAAAFGIPDTHSDTHAHGPAQTPFGQLSTQHEAHAHPTEHSDSTAISCLFYHVLLATPGTLTTGLQTAVSLPGTQPQLPYVVRPSIAAPSGTTSIRGPPDAI